jgi:hypothetical protein
MSNFNVITHNKKNYADDMGWACSAYGGEERHIQGFDGEI